MGLGEDDVIARSYLPGDAMKRLHWRATAHHGELMVRQEEQQLTPRAAVVLDCEPVSQGTAKDRQGEWEYSAVLEWCVAATASITTHLVKAGYVVVLQSNGTGIDRFIADGQDTLEDAMVDLAVIEPEEHDNDRRVAPERAVFMVLGRLTIERAQHWAHLMSTSRAVMALIAANTSAEARGILEDARWRLVTYHPNDDISDLWTEFDGARTHAAG